MNRFELDKIISLINKTIEHAGYECIEIDLIGSEKILRVFIDHPNGIKIDDCASVNRELMNSVEFTAKIPDDFVIEISSPGVERPLRKAGHFEKHIGERVRVRLGAEQSSSRRQGIGMLKAITDDGNVTLVTDQGDWSFPLATLQNASLVYDWESRN